MMRIALILTTSIAASFLIFLISRQIARLANRNVILLAVVAFSLYGALLFWRPQNWMLINAVVLSVAAVGGSGLGLLINSRVSLITFCIVASVVDIYSVLQGTTANLVDSYREGSSDLLRYLVISIPLGGDVKPVVGIGDFFIISAICFVLVRLGYQQSQIVLAPLSGLLLAIVVGLLVGGIFAIPFIGATTIAYLYWQQPAEK